MTICPFERTKAERRDRGLLFCEIGSDRRAALSCRSGAFSDRSPSAADPHKPDEYRGPLGASLLQLAPSLPEPPSLHPEKPPGRLDTWKRLSASAEEFAGSAACRATPS